ncbi:MAG: bifunctional DNA-formamidopyrimidine glycosylase/DNA-(apurinic or apyrimidinic site) lyase [Actinomycetota bacterium]
MPALPEVEVIRRDLEKEIVGRRIKDVEIRPGTNAMKIIRRHGRRKEFQDLLVGSKVQKIDRVGRRLLLELDSDRVLVFDLADSASLLKTSSSDEVASHTHIVIAFTIGGQLRVVDPRRAGEVFVVPRDELEAVAGLRGYEMDPLDSPIAWPRFSALLEEHEVPVRELLLDGSFIVGLGEIYTDEILFTAGIRHDRPSNKLGSQDVRRLYRALMETLQDAVKARGTTLGEQGFRDLQGQPGTYQLELKVYERDGEACRRCRNTVVKAAVNGGFTYFCPQCQS